MISKELFMKGVRSLKEYSLLQYGLQELGYAPLNNNAGVSLMDTCIELLYSGVSQEVKDKELIEKFCWECNFGFKPLQVEKGEYVDTADELWYYLSKQG